MATKLTKFDLAVQNLLSDEKLNNFQDFYAFIKNEGLLKGVSFKSDNPKAVSEIIRHQGREVCRLYITKDLWKLRFFYCGHVSINQCEGLVPDYLRDFILEKIVTELPCKSSCQTSSSMTVFGKSFDVVCKCNTIKIENPSGKTLENIKELVLIHMKIIEKIVADYLTVTEDTKIHFGHHSISPDRGSEGNYLKEEYRNYFYETLGNDCEKYPTVKNFFENMEQDAEQYLGYTLKYLKECCLSGTEPEPNIAMPNIQKKLKPNIEDVIKYAAGRLDLDSEYWNNALEFIQWLRENKMKSRLSGINCDFTASVKGRILYSIRLGCFADNFSGTQYARFSNKWETNLYLIYLNDYEDKIFAEGMQNFVWDHFSNCNGCLEKCGSTRKRTILGKELIGLGCRLPMKVGGRLFVNKADEATINNMKKLILWEREARNNANMDDLVLWPGETKKNK